MARDAWAPIPPDTSVRDRPIERRENREKYPGDDTYVYLRFYHQFIGLDRAGNGFVKIDDVRIITEPFALRAPTAGNKGPAPATAPRAVTPKESRSSLFVLTNNRGVTACVRLVPQRGCVKRVVISRRWRSQSRFSARAVVPPGPRISS